MSDAYRFEDRQAVRFGYDGGSLTAGRRRRRHVKRGPPHNRRLRPQQRYVQVTKQRQKRRQTDAIGVTRPHAAEIRYVRQYVNADE